MPGVAAAQDLRYTYDPVGNVAEVADAAQQSLIFAGVPVDPVLRFEYDALYRLVAAEGRELAGVDAQPAASDILRSAVPSATAARRYRETYAYDPGGNITSMRHEGGAGWERRYAYAVGSNRISEDQPARRPGGGAVLGDYAHDARGNVTAMPHLASLGWDAKDRLTTVDLGGGGTVHYTYDSAGRRVRKVVQRVGSIVEETVYVAGWERFRRRNGAGLVAERETLHVSDGGQRIAIMETETRDAGGPIADPAPRIRYQLHNRLGSSTLEIDDSGRGRELRGVLPVRRDRVRRRARPSATGSVATNATTKPVSTTAMPGITRRGSVAGSARTPPVWPTARTSTPTPVAIRPPTPTRQAPRADTTSCRARPTTP